MPPSLRIMFTSENQIVDRTGKVYGKLTVIKRIPHPPGVKGKNAKWECSCLCGNTAIISSKHLREGGTKSCGCLWHNGQKTHGLTVDRKPHPLFCRWSAMWFRCTNPKHKAFHRYGGRGIKVCDRWKDFALFVADVGERPGPGFTLDRIDNDGDYEPSNIRWATWSQQNLNKPGRRIVTLDGVTAHANVWAEKSPVAGYLIWIRILDGWCPRCAIFNPPRVVCSHIND